MDRAGTRRFHGSKGGGFVKLFLQRREVERGWDEYG